MELFEEGCSIREEIKNKLRQNFDGKIVRKDLTKKIKEGANVPVYVLEFLLGQYCSSDDEEVIEQGVQNVKRILADNFVRPDEAQKILSQLRKKGSHTIIDSTRIYNIYLKYIAPEDIHVYSIDEVFIDLTHYLSSSGLNAREFAKRMIQDVLETTGITATAGIGTNMYLAKVAMDIVAKHIPADENGVRIAELDEMSYRRQLWSHRPLTDFWRVGRGYAKKLEEVGLFTMGDIARCSVGRSNDYYNEDLLYKLFGINAELLIDHAWGWEPCTIAEVKQYKPESNSVGSGQVLHCPYDFEKARLIVREMIDLLVLDLVDKGMVTDQIVLTVGYDIENLSDPVRRKAYKGQITTDRYGRQVPKHAHGTANIGRYTSSTRLVTDAVLELYQDYLDYEEMLMEVIDEVPLDWEFAKWVESARKQKIEKGR